ncbi:class I adenylate-forming enzyme family protein [Microbacterium sp. APC 3898]|uniref:Class I adenylate-forming enzyme family protein n=1 Tax=Planococcus notacanthi TaxID=3035188 RepID=A0ABT7ZKI4_9BACL|nr:MULTISPECIES: class I adenylate-forming enzyme family protein [Terrabacteria group]MDN3427665.1 class I adenylate-forming enzyme family protein [Planococcus sp. APC 4016]MDN3499217.1 class I adenylate-forming enzyme family protein [Microbacterium sp. APC 3898]
MEIQEISLFGRENVKIFKKRPKTIGEIIQRSSEIQGDKLAVVTEDQSLSYRELEDQSDAIAANLQNRGIAKGDRVAVVVGNRAEFPLLVLACAKIGAIMVPINVKLAEEELQYIFGHSKPRIIISEVEFFHKVEKANQGAAAVSLENIFVIDGQNSYEQLLVKGGPYRQTDVGEEDGVFILYTSGTTGRPKGAVLTHINVVHSLMNYKSVFATDDTFKTLIAVPMFHVTGLVGQLLHMFYVGGTVYSMRRYQNEEYINRILEHKINFLFNVPTIFIMMSTSEEFQKHSFDFVKKVAFGGSPIYQQTFAMLKKAFPNAQLHNAYGATETTSPATLMPLDYPDSKVTSVGLPVEVGDIKIVDAEGKECPTGESGELYIKGPMIIKEYWDNPTANQSSFTDGYWHSGDLGIQDEDGFIYIRDRKKDMINRAGEKIFSIEVEDVLKAHPDVVEAAVIGEPDPVFGEKVKAFVVGPKLDAEDFSALKEHCRKSLAKFKVPEEFELIDSLPRNASGKILKNTLKTIGGKTNA